MNSSRIRPAHSLALALGSIGAGCLVVSQALAAGCLKDQTQPCSTNIIDPIRCMLCNPSSEEACCDLVIGTDPTIDRVITILANGHKASIQNLPAQSVTVQRRLCQGQNCVDGVLEVENCASSKLIPPLNTCTYP